MKRKTIINDWLFLLFLSSQNHVTVVLSFAISIGTASALSFTNKPTFSTTGSSIVHQCGSRSTNKNTNASKNTSRNNSPSPRVPSLLYQSMETKEAPAKEKEKEEEGTGISDLDARVLQSLLEDEDLDLKSEENLKKMLENKKKGVGQGKGGDNNDNSQFSSTFFKTVSDNTLWNSVRAKADSILESTKIFVQNRIERDAQLLASISVFAWERAMKDVGRALPSAGKSGAFVADKVKKTVLSLSNNSSFVENMMNNNNKDHKDNNGPFLLSSNSQFENNVMEEEKTIYDELTTPRDEIQKVSESIRDILSGKSKSSDRGLRSVAPAGTARNKERQRLAYERRKETLLKREKEGIDKKAMRAASSVTDAAWEIKREMQIEGNEAGYRSEAAYKRLEASITSSALLEGGKNWIGRRLTGGKEATPQLESSTDYKDEKSAHVDSTIQDSNIDDVVVESKTFSIADANIFEPEIVQIKDTTIAANTETVPPISTTTDTVTTAAVDTIPNTIAPTTATIISVDNEKSEVEQLVENITEKDLSAERERLVSILNTCLEEPDKTWLRPELLSTSPTEKDKNEEEVDRPFFLTDSSEEKSWEKAITAMVSAKYELEPTNSLEVKEKSQEEIIAELDGMQKTVEKITGYVAESAGDDSAEFVRMELLGETSSLLGSKKESAAMIDEKQEIPEIVVDIDGQGTNNVMKTQTMPKRVSTVRSDDHHSQFSGKTEPSIIIEEKEDIMDNFDDNINGFTDAFHTVTVTDVLSSDEELPKGSPSMKSKHNNVLDVLDVLTDVDFEVNSSKETWKKSESNSNYDDGVFAADVEVVISNDDDIMKDSEPMSPMNSAAVEEEEILEEKKKGNVVVTFALRTIDVTFFVTEKALTVGLPGMFSAWEVIGKKTETINRKGLGKEGWDTLNNISNAKNRY